MCFSATCGNAGYSPASEIAEDHTRCGYFFRLTICCGFASFLLLWPNHKLGHPRGVYRSWNCAAVKGLRRMCIPGINLDEEPTVRYSVCLGLRGLFKLKRTERRKKKSNSFYLAGCGRDEYSKRYTTKENGEPRTTPAAECSEIVCRPLPGEMALPGPGAAQHKAPFPSHNAPLSFPG